MMSWRQQPGTPVYTKDFDAVVQRLCSLLWGHVVSQLAPLRRGFSLPAGAGNLLGGVPPPPDDNGRLTRAGSRDDFFWTPARRI